MTDPSTLTTPTNNSLIKKLQAALETIVARGKVYGTSHKGHHIAGTMLAAMFPEGLTLRTPEDFTRFELLCMCVMKINRYGNNFTKGGHQDSIHDLGVYSFILEDYDDNVDNREQ